MNANVIIKNLILAAVSIASVSLLNLQKITAQPAAIDGTNLDFMEHTPPSFDGWTAKTGTYTTGGYYSSSNPLNTTCFNLTTSFADPSTATFTGGYTGETTKAFVINTDVNAKDEHSSNKLKKIPTHLGFTRSVRLGPISGTNGGNKSAELSYRLKINDTNSLLTFCYAMVLMAPHNGEHYANPTFEVDVVDALTDALIKPCCFFQNCGDLSCSQLPTGWNLGEGNCTPGGWNSDVWLYSDWNQITVNLDEFFGQTIKLRVRISGCVYSAHGGYGYFVAKASKSSITLAGCAGDGNVVTYAEAPSGFNSYEWFEIPAGMTDQYDIDGVYSANNVIGTDSILTITTTTMNNQDDKSFAVRLTSPKQHVTWDNSPAPACVTYIPTDVHDMRPKFDNMIAHKYIPTNPENSVDEIGFLFDDVTKRNNNYPLDWHLLDFGDGDSLEIVKNNDGSWSIDEQTTPLTENHVRIAYKTNINEPDTIFHTYQHGNYIFTRCAHSYPTDPTNELECTKCDTLHITVPVRPSLLFISPDTICYNDNVTITATSPGDDATNYIYQWWHSDDNIQTTPPFHEGTSLTINNLKEDLIVHVKVITADGFYRWGWDTVRVQAFPDIQIGGDTMICVGEILHLTATDVSGGTLGMKWTYQKPNLQTSIPNSSNQISLEDAVVRDTTIFVIAQTTKHCVAWKSVQILVVDPKVVANKKEICVGDEVVLTGSGAFDFSWESTPKDNSLPEDVKGINPITVYPTQTTEYTMIGYGQNGCQARVNITVNVIPNPVVNLKFSPNEVDMDEPTVMFFDSSEYSAKSEWIFSDGEKLEGKNITHKFNISREDSVNIHLISSNILGCSSEADTTIPVVLFAIWFPNAFTPDGDGMNDYFFFMTKNNLEDIVFEIFDRWGMKVYSYESKYYKYQGKSDIKTLGWDGRFKNKFVQNDVYVWRISYRRPGNSRVYDQQGTVTTIR